jgi:murein DD-endopeptidase MepM/ murein hydrolase activator NlpD
VAPGDAVRRGDIVGFVGSTGRSTGDHVHYEVLVNGQTLNPLRFLLERAR